VKKYEGLFKGYSLALQISSILLCSIFGALFGGIWLDQKFSTTPCLMLILMVLGMAFAMYTIYRTVKEAE
jgi:F0F1-type ATP synthase assembly protein I